MNREIKFRAWDESQEYMAYQGTPDLETIQSFMHHFGNNELMQSTGLADKNGKEIFEKDIVVDDDGYKWDVRFYNGRFIPLVYVKENYNCIDKYDPKLFEVIGNIFENTELLVVS